MSIENIPAVEVTKSDLRTFGFIMGIMIVLIFGLFFPWLFDKTKETWPMWPFIAMAIFFALALIAPQVLAPVNTLWLKIGYVLGWVNTRIILGIMFFLLIFPMGLALKLLGKDSMKRKMSDDVDSYRVTVTPRDKKHLEKPF